MLYAARTLLARAASLSVFLLAQPSGLPFQSGSITPPVAQWQVAAGSKLAFDVVSVKPALAGTYRPALGHFPLDAGNAYGFTGGRFSAAFPLIVYVMFAYKLTLTPDQIQALLAPLPKWVATDTFDIQARAPESNPTKDQLRLMMQSLLAERFNLAVHFETRTVPALALVLTKPGKLGPQLHAHDEGPPCPAPYSPNVVPEHVKGVFPPACETYALLPQANGMLRLGSRNTTMELLAAMVPTLGSLGRPVVDRTGLTGAFDFTLDFTPESHGPVPPAGDVPTEPAGPTLLEALKEQLGVKLEPVKAPVQVLIVDRIERPSEN